VVTRNETKAIHKSLDAGRTNLRVANDDRALDKLDREMVARDNCEHLIGELNSGKVYIITRAGKVKEFARRDQAEDFLIRNGYVGCRKGEIPQSYEIQ
jgi:hypothetical protein